MSHPLMRTRLVDALAAAPAVTAVVAPAGWGKSTLLESAATSDLRVVPVSLSSTEGHPSLFVDALAQGLKRAYPGTAVAAVRAVGGLRTSEPPHLVLERTREALATPTLTLGLDEVERLPAGPVLELLRRLIAARPAGLRLIFASRQSLPAELGGGERPLLGVRELALTLDEIDDLIHGDYAAGAPARNLARAVLEETGGWPALVSARLRASRSTTTRPSVLVSALSPIVEEAIAQTRAETRYVLQIAAVVGRFSRPYIQAIIGGEVAGTPEARRRLLRLEPAVVNRALDELVRASLVLEDDPDAARLKTLPGLQSVLRQRFLAQDRAGWQEAHRRAAELRLAALEDPPGEAAVLGPDIVDLFAAADERARLLDILSRHGARLELELPEDEGSERILGWIEALEPGATPYWCEVLAGLALARRGETDGARERLERARDKLAADKRDPTVWRWQVRIAEAQALAARAKADFSDARSWLLRALDQVEHTRKRGLAPEESAEADALELRLAVTLARLSRESTGWDKTREAAMQALALCARRSCDPEVNLELRRMLVAGAFAAGDGAALEPETEREPIDPVSQAARIALALLRDGSIERAVERLRVLVAEAREPLGNLFLGRLLEPGAERNKVLELAQRANDPWVSLEARLRRAAVESPSYEGFSGAVAAEGQANGPGRQLELARDSYRRVGARWEEARLWLALGAAAARRVDDGDGDVEAVVRPVDGIVEAAQAMGFTVPWTFAGRGEPDPERRVRTLLLAGLRGGADKTKLACRLELERLGVDARQVAVAPERGRLGTSGGRRIGTAAGSPFVQLSRNGAQGLSAADYQAIINGRSSSSFVVCVPDQIVLNFGRQVSLGQKRVMMPLLLHLLRNPDESFSMLELAREVWSAPELTPTVQTKVKVAVSRLRALLGKNRHYIITTRKTEDGQSVVAYQAAPQLPFSIIEAAPRE